MPSKREISRFAFSERSLNEPHHSNIVRTALCEDECLLHDSANHRVALSDASLDRAPRRRS